MIRSPRKLGQIPILSNIFIKWVGSTTNVCDDSWHFSIATYGCLGFCFPTWPGERFCWWASTILVQMLWPKSWSLEVVQELWTVNTRSWALRFLGESNHSLEMHYRQYRLVKCWRLPMFMDTWDGSLQWFLSHFVVWSMRLNFGMNRNYVIRPGLFSVTPT